MTYSDRLGDTMSKEQKYYLCTFKVIGEDVGYYKTIAIDCHPADFMMCNPGMVLINHIEMTHDQYVMYMNDT